MRVDAFHNWRRELEAVEQEMNSLLAQGLPASSQERQVRRTRFAALIERREAAARNLLRSDVVPRRSKPPTRGPGPGDHVIAPARAPAGPEGQAEAFVPLPEGTRKPEAQPEGSADRRTDLADIWKPDRGAATVPPDAAAPGFPAAVADPAPPAEPPKTPKSSIPISSVLDSSVRDSSVPDSRDLADPGSIPADVAAPVPEADSFLAEPAARDATTAAPAKPAELPAAVLALAAEAAALASEASGQRGQSIVRAHSASEDARERAGDTRPEPGSSARAALASEASDQRGNFTSARAGHSPEAGSSARAALASESDAVPPAPASDAAPAPAPDVVSVAVASIAAAMASMSDAAVPAAAVSESAEPAADVIVLAPVASTEPAGSDDSATGLAAGLGADLGAARPADIVVSPADAVAVVADPEPQSAPSEDPQSEALLRKLLRRLQFGR